MSGKLNKVNFLLGANLQSRRWLMERKFEAVDSNDVDKLAELLTYPDAHNNKQLTKALEMAIMKKSDDYTKIIELLLSKGADPRGSDGGGAPFVMKAADAGCSAILKLLLDFGADPNQKAARADRSTPLHRACWNDNAECVKILLERGADTELTDSKGRTPIILAAKNNSVEAVRELLTEGCDVDHQGPEHKSAIYWATFQGSLEILEMFIEVEAELGLTDKLGMTPLMMAVGLSNGVMVDLLLKYDCNINARNSKGETALLLAAQTGQLKISRQLVEAGADVTATDNDGMVALMHVVHCSELVKLMLSRGADPNARSQHNVTALKMALCNLVHRRVDVVRILIKANCDVTRKMGSSENSLPLQLAVDQSFMSLSKMIFIASLASGSNLRELRDVVASRRNRMRLFCDTTELTQWLETELNLMEVTPSLMRLSRTCIRRHLGSIKFLAKVNTLPLPQKLKRYVRLDEIDSVV